MDDTPALKQLKEHLTALPPGEVAAHGALIARLAGCWHQLDGGDAEGMKTSKLARMEDVRWEAPILSFQLERHGSLARGSTRAELQFWSVDLDSNRASCEKGRSYRQLLPRAEQVKVEPIASEIAEAITAGRDDHRLKWASDGTVRVVLTKVFPYNSGYMQTIAGRLKRLRETLTRLLAERGWRKIRPDVYARTPE
ncbi:MAG: hypothetical protein ABSD31_15930 [Candidatus Binataceae bacterium]